MSEISPAAIAYARKVYTDMVGGRPLTLADASAMTELAIAFEATERAARKMFEHGVAAEREACAAAVESLGDFDAYGIRAMCAETIRARGKK